MKDIPFVLIHHGKQPYLLNSINSIEKYHTLYLIGDGSNKELTNNWVDSSSLTSEYKSEFDQYYRHMSTNSEFFEKICFYRYVLMYEFAKRYKFEELVHCDSDLILLESCHELLNTLKNEKYKAAYSIPENQNEYRMTASPHFSYWTLDGLRDFINFFILKYKKDDGELVRKFDFHKRENIPGGICDMTLLYLFSVQEQTRIFNLLEVDDCCVDFNIGTTENTKKHIHKTILGMKVFKKENNSLYYQYQAGIEKKVVCLHMQGSAKRFMKNAYNHDFHMLFFKVNVLILLRKIYRFCKCSIK